MDSDIDYQLKKKQRIYCPAHPTKKYQLHCVDDNVPICLKCISQNHQGHKVVELEDHVEEIIKEEGGMDLLEKANEILAQEDAGFELFEKELNDQKKIIKGFFEYMQNFLYATELNLVSSLEQIASTTRDKLNDDNESLKECKFKFENADLFKTFEIKSYLREELQSSERLEFEKLKENFRLAVKSIENSDYAVPKFFRNPYFSVVLNNLFTNNLKILLHNNSEKLFNFDGDTKFFLVYDAANLTMAKRELNINFTIPLFSAVATTHLTGRVFLTGGKSKYIDDSQFCTLELAADCDGYSVVRRQNMNCARNRHSMVALKDDFLFVVGGNSNYKAINTFEAYDISTCEWIKGPNMINTRENLTISLHDDKFLYAFGGFNEAGKDVKVIERSELLITKSILENSPIIENGKPKNIIMKNWEIFHFSNEKEWVPAECSGALQIERDKILIFGGFRADKKEMTSDCFLIDLAKRDIVKSTEKMNKGDIFCHPPKRIGNLVYSLSAENTLHKLSVKQGELKWEEAIKLIN